MSNTSNGIDALAVASFGKNGESSPNVSSSSRNKNDLNNSDSKESSKRLYDNQQTNFMCPTPNTYMKNMFEAAWAASDPTT